MQIDVTRDVFRLRRAFTISRGSRTEAQVLTVRLRDGEFCGLGECVPYARYGETLDTVAADFSDFDMLAMSPEMIAFLDAKVGDAKAQTEFSQDQRGKRAPPQPAHPPHQCPVSRPLRGFSGFSASS